MKWLDRMFIKAAQWVCDKTGLTKFMLGKWALVTATVFFWIGALAEFNGFFGSVVAIVCGLSFTTSMAISVSIIKKEETKFLTKKNPEFISRDKILFRMVLVFFFAITVAIALSLPRLPNLCYLVVAVCWLASAYLESCVPRREI